MLKEKLWSFGNQFTIKNAHGEDAYRVVGKPFSWGHKLRFQNTDGQELAVISQKLMSWKPRYEIFRDGARFAEVTKDHSWLKSRFTLDVPGPNDYTITGSFWEHEFAFERAGRTVASVSKEYWSWSDTYGIDVVDGEDDVAILATSVVIDLVCNDAKGA